MYNGCISPCVAFRVNGSVPIRFSDSCYCFDGGLQSCELRSAYDACSYCCCCKLCVHRVDLNSGLVYGLKQSSLLQWSGGRRLKFGGAGSGIYSRLCGVDRVDYGFECCDGDTRKVLSFEPVDYGGGRERRVGKGRIGGLGIVERREWRRYAGGLSEAEDLIDLLADSVVESTVVSIEAEIVRPRRKKEEKKENVCDECIRRKMTSVASGSSRGKLRHDELKKIDITSTGHGCQREEDFGAEKKSKVRKSGGGSGSLQEKSRREELTRADLVSVARGRRRSEGVVNMLSEKNEKLIKEGSGCTSYYSMSSSGDIESDEDIVSLEELANNTYVEGQSSKLNKDFSTQNDEESYDYVEETERRKNKQQGTRLEDTMASGSHEGNVVAWDRKKSEKQLVETAVDESQSAAKTAEKRFTASEAYDSSYNKSDVSHKQFQSSEDKSSLISNRLEGRIQSDTTASLEILGSRRRYNKESKSEEVHESDVITNSNQLLQSRMRQEDATTSTNLTHAITENREKELVRRSSQQRTGTVRIEEIDDTSEVSNFRRGKQSTSVQELKGDHRRISTVTDAELRRHSQQITNISKTSRSEIQKTSISKKQSDSSIKVGEISSSSVTGRSEVEMGTILQAGSEDRQQIQSKRGSRASLESIVKIGGLTTTIDSQTTSDQGVHISDARVAGESQHNESYKQIEARRERQRLASEDAFKLSFETRAQKVITRADDKRTTQQAAHQPQSGGSFSKVPTSSYVYEMVSQDDIEDRYRSQHLQQGLYRSSELESCSGDTRDDTTYVQPLSHISSEDALGSAERIENSSNVLIEEFIEQANIKLCASEVKEEKLKNTGSANEDSRKQAMVKYGSAGLKSSPHSSEGSEAKVPSDEKWDVAQSSVEPSAEVKTPEVSPKAGKTPAKRTGRSLWNVIGDVVRARWIFRGEGQRSPSKSQRRSSSNESVSSDTWFSGPEQDENITKETEKRNPFHESASPYNQLKSGEEHTKRQRAGSDSVAVTDEHGVSGSLLTSVLSDSSSAVQGVSLKFEETKPSSSLPDVSMLATFSSPGMLGTSASFPSRQLRRSPAIGSISLSARNDPTASGASFPSRQLSKSPAIGSTSLSARKDPTSSGAAELTNQQPSPLRLTEASEAEEKEREQTRRKFQRTTQVPRDKFEEWEEALKRETEQHKIDDIFMRETLLEAQKAAHNWEVPVGAVLVKHGKIIARGCNLVEELRDSTAHAEMICIRDASNALRTWRLAETTLYVTLEPCAMCAGAILQARVTSLVWGAPNKLLGADGSWIRLFPEDHERENIPELADKPPAPVHPFHPKMNIRRGVLASECAQVMQHFFQLRRQKKNKSEPSSSPPSCLPVATNPVKLITKVHGLFGSSLCL